MIRGYHILRDNGDLDFIYKCHKEISHHLYDESKKSKSLKHYISDIAESYPSYFPQFFLTMLIRSDLNSSLLQYFGHKQANSLLYPLPMEVQKVLEGQGLKIANISSAILWWAQCLLVTFKALLLVGKISFDSIKWNLFKLFQSIDLKPDYVLFFNINRNCLPKSPNDENYHLINWYINWKNRNTRKSAMPSHKVINRIIHQVPDIPNWITNNYELEYRDSLLPPIDNLINLLKFLAISLQFSIYSLFQHFVGNWRYSFLSFEIIRLFQVRYTSTRNLPKEVYFNNSSGFYRPLWTYEAECRGVDIYYYFYSTNIELLDDRLNTGWDLVTWPKYIVWDEYTRNFLKKNSPITSNYDVSGPIYFEDTAGIPVEIPDNSFAVFDVQPVRDSIYRTLGIGQEYYTPKTSKLFFRDIREIIGLLDANLIFKGKRDIGKNLHPHYRHFINEYTKDEKFIHINSGINPAKIIPKVRGVICMPFTSVAHIAKNLGIPAVFYDPLGCIKKEHKHLSHGLPLLNTPQELKQWVLNIDTYKN